MTAENRNTLGGHRPRLQTITRHRLRSLQNMNSPELAIIMPVYNEQASVPN